MQLDPLDAVISKLRSIPGVIDIWQVEPAGRLEILRLEEVSNRTLAFPGLPTVNEGARLALQREFVVCISHSSALRHPSKPILILTTGEEVVGREVWEKGEVAMLEADPNVMFLGKNFAIFRDKLEAAKGKDLRFVFEPQGVPEIEVIQGIGAVVSATLSPVTDAYIKRRANWDTTDSDRGTVLIGFNSTGKQR